MLQPPVKMWTRLIQVLFAIGLSSAVKLPATWKACKTDSKMNSCLESAIEGAIVSMKNGMPSIGVTPLEPLHFERMLFDQRTGPVAITLEFKNVDMKGLTAVSVKHVQSNLTKGHIMFDMFFKNPIILDADYLINGKILILPIQGNGTVNMIFEDLHHSIEIKGKVVDKKSEKYLQVESFTVDIQPKLMTVNFTNLFNGNKELGDNMNRFINAHWSEIFNELSPTVSAAFGAGLKEISNRVFQKIPLSQLVKN